jgi:hypothetical protein
MNSAAVNVASMDAALAKLRSTESGWTGRIWKCDETM